MTRSVGDTTRPMCLTAAPIIVTLTAKGALVNLTRIRATEGHAVIFEFDHGTGRFSSHVMNGVLICRKMIMKIHKNKRFNTLNSAERQPYLWWSAKDSPYLISKPIGSFNRVVKMPTPVIGLHISQSGIDPTLSGYGVATSRE
uniref:Uncharacterized protein n=1 Tax=Romanomermis culicivorax TaxID=13658 RepID=A0A915J7J5_ROMCU